MRINSPIVSIVTPTFNREAYLPLIYSCILNQTYKDWEWIIVDDSAQPSQFIKSLKEPRINYQFLPSRINIGDKRNLCVDFAQGEFIVHFDDDEFYAPHYIDSMIKLLHHQKGDLLKLSAFFIYSTIYKKFAYWNLYEKTGIHYIWSPQPMVVGSIDNPNTDLTDNHLGYGFSYVYRKIVPQTIRFESTTFNEDAPFVKAAMALGFKTHLLADDIGLCIHVLHNHNSSKCFPQYVLPKPIVQRIFGILPIDIFN